MYLAHWGLADRPFRNTPDPRYLFLSAAQQEALTRALYALTEGAGGFLLTGEVGCGKTLALRALLGCLDPSRFEAAYLAFPDLPPDGFLRDVLRAFGYQPDGWTRDEARLALASFLALAARRGMSVVVVVDEAQTIRDAETWDELRLFLNHQQDRRFGMTLMLAGQPELRGRLSAIPPLAQRLAVQAHLGRFTDAESEDYLRHRILEAGGKEGIFTPEAIRWLAESSGGIPRRINHLADMALLAGYGERAQQVDEALAKRAVGEVPVWEQEERPVLTDR